MTDITSDCTFYYNLNGNIKEILIVTPATAATSDTIDLNSDVANAKGSKIKTITNSLFQDDVGTDVVAAWDPATGIITLGTISTGIHNLIIWGLG